MNLERQFLDSVPNGVYLSEDRVKEINNYLISKGWLRPGELLQDLEKAGEGNMNCVLRARTNYRTFILKQSRPWVEKYPQIAAPIERVKVEAEFVRRSSAQDFLKPFCPMIRHYDEENFLIFMEDLGAASDFMDLYKGGVLTEDELDVLMTYLNALHAMPSNSFPDNHSMRILNYEHIFIIPFTAQNDHDLDSVQSGLADLARTFTGDSSIKNRVETMGKKYLENGTTLLHGDFYPGSFLRTDAGVKVIDAEFAFPGFPEFDWAVLYAHLHMADQSKEILEAFSIEISQNPKLNKSIVEAYAGVEILRRFYGVAQLPLTLDIDQKARLTEQALTWIRGYA